MKVLRNRFLLRVVSIFFTIEILVTAIVPAVSYALTAGPTAPESSSFEPVDTTDLVDLKTGDFTYNVPLLEVPGPAGGYPLSLSYHAGIQTNQEASWVGLGFTLNPGSISRIVNGYPDDHMGVSNVSREFWEGGRSESTTVGLSTGIPKVISVSADLTFANDTYKGRGVGFGFGVGMGPFQYYGGVSPFGVTHASVGVGLGNAVSVAQNSNGETSLQLSVGKSWSFGRSNISMGYSISSDSDKPSLSVSGLPNFIHQQNQGKVSEDVSGWSVNIPLYWVNLRLSRSYVRYWIDEKSYALTYGSLYPDRSTPSSFAAFDNFDLLDTKLNISDHSNPEKVLGGSLPDVDSYMVTGQGIGGSIQPYHFQQELFSQEKRRSDGTILVKSRQIVPVSEKKIGFRFLNDFSNRYEYDPKPIYPFPDYFNPFGPEYKTGETGSDSFQDNELAGSKTIKWYTNRQILEEENLQFLNTTSEGFIRNNNDQIGGFAITQSNGVTYHYSLPVYSFDEYMKSKRKEEDARKDGEYYNELKKPEKYAYTWLLTAVTGPDYIDKNSNGLADKGDWGYWVCFNYSKWVSDYKWRNPATGYHMDIDDKFEFFSAGKKELYYLDQIITETHIAVFNKSERLDSRETISLYSGGFHPQSYVKVPGKEQCQLECDQLYCPTENCYEPDWSNCLSQCEFMEHDQIGYVVPRSTLRLNSIVIYNSSDYEKSKNGVDLSLRTIRFNYDYSLAPETINSYNPNSPETLLGKLTLKSVDFVGRQSKQTTPPIRFNYAKNKLFNKEYYDNWGYYKNDYTDTDNENLDRFTTTTSANDVDAWSLTSIQTMLGSTIKVEYESDEYNTPVLYKNNLLSIKSISANEDNGTIRLEFAPTSLMIPELLEMLKKSRLYLLYGRPVTAVNDVCVCADDRKMGVGSFLAFKYIDHEIALNVSNIVQVESNSLEIVDAKLFDDLTSIIPSTYWSQLFSKRQCTTLSGAEIDYEVTVHPGLFISGNVVIQENQFSKGGGLRVKSVSINSTNGSLTTSFSYENGTTSYEPINFGKVDFNFHNALNLGIVHEIERAREARTKQETKLYKSFESLLATSRIVPGPGVMYEKVSMHESTKTKDGIVHNNLNHSIYEFEVFNNDMVMINYEDFRTYMIEDVQPPEGWEGGVYPYFESDGVEYSGTYTREIQLKDYTATIGNLRSITLMTGENSITNKTIYEYLNSSPDYETLLKDRFNNQGLIDQTFLRGRYIFYDGNEKMPYPKRNQTTFSDATRFRLVTSTKKSTFPAIQIGTKTVNYITGMKSETSNLAFDYFSGEVIKTAEKNSYGVTYLNQIIPAYRVYPEMGLKSLDEKRMNMLTQTAGSYSYVVDENYIPTGLISASINIWSNQVKVLGTEEPQDNIWRMQAAYAWNGQSNLQSDGSYPMETFSPYNWESGSQNPHWLKTSENTLFDYNSHILEANDINGKYSSVKMDPENIRVIASGSRSRYEEMAFSGSEYYSGNLSVEGGIHRGQGNATRGFAHTGKYSLLVSTGTNGFTYSLKPEVARLDKKYKASVWVYAPGESESQGELDKIELFYNINGKERGSIHPTIQKKKSKSWYLLELDVVPDGNNEITIAVRNNSTRGVYFDDFRVHPLNSTLTAYVYDPFTGDLTDVLDANNFYTHYEYDENGRLVRVTKELLNYDFGDGKESYRADAILNEFRYNYGLNK